MKLFASFVVQNALNAIFWPNEQIFSVKSIMFIKRNKKKPCSFLKCMGEIHRFFCFYVKIFQYWLKFLGCPQNFGVLHLKM